MSENLEQLVREWNTPKTCCETAVDCAGGLRESRRAQAAGVLFVLSEPDSFGWLSFPCAGASMLKMSNGECPMCAMSDLLEHPSFWECETCGHEWPGEEKPEEASGQRVVRDAHGTALTDGDSVTLIKDLKLKGSTQVVKGGTKAKGIRLVEGDHEISCKIEGVSIGLKACFVRKA
jgi:protein PhnA